MKSTAPVRTSQIMNTKGRSTMNGVGGALSMTPPPLHAERHERAAQRHGVRRHAKARKAKRYLRRREGAGNGPNAPQGGVHLPLRVARESACSCVALSQGPMPARHDCSLRATLHSTITSVEINAISPRK